MEDFSEIEEEILLLEELDDKFFAQECSFEEIVDNHQKHFTLSLDKQIQQKEILYRQFSNLCCHLDELETSLRRANILAKQIVQKNHFLL